MDDIDQGIAMACNLIASHLHSFFAENETRNLSVYAWYSCENIVSCLDESSIKATQDPQVGINFFFFLKWFGNNSLINLFLCSGLDLMPRRSGVCATPPKTFFDPQNLLFSPHYLIQVNRTFIFWLVSLSL